MGSTRRDSSLTVSCMFCSWKHTGPRAAMLAAGRQHRLLHPQGTRPPAA